jgi:hypothetical protein
MSNKPNSAEAKDEFERMKDPAYDPTDDPKYIRKEFRYGIMDTKATTVASSYAAGKASTLIYDAPISKEGLKCFHLAMSICSPFSCMICNHEALYKYTFHRIYDDHVESNVPMSCLCWVMDMTSIAYLDRDWAQKFEQAGLCSPGFTHCMLCPDGCGKCGTTAIGHGATNGVCCAGGRRIDTPMLPMGCRGGPCLFGFCPVGNEQWICFPFVEKDGLDTFIQKLTDQRAAMVEAHKVVAGKAGLADAPAEGEQSRDA